MSPSFQLQIFFLHLLLLCSAPFATIYKSFLHLIQDKTKELDLTYMVSTQHLIRKSNEQRYKQYRAWNVQTKCPSGYVTFKRFISAQRETKGHEEDTSLSEARVTHLIKITLCNWQRHKTNFLWTKHCLQLNTATRLNTKDQTHDVTTLGRNNTGKTHLQPWQGGDAAMLKTDRFELITMNKIKLMGIPSSLHTRHQTALVCLAF